MQKIKVKDVEISMEVDAPLRSLRDLQNINKGGFVGACFRRPHGILNTFSELSYENFLEFASPHILDNVPINICFGLNFMHDRVLHFSIGPRVTMPHISFRDMGNMVEQAIAAVNQRFDKIEPAIYNSKYD
ncbi:hypothetical protein Anas_03209 [Armadillidium nasatum]|uniref:Uncharacterized protein n=1 Tax=Armadillidium nasatum TaxID=96803 RepID=A0A5N5SVV5_9CRUS|nr:hypothetical protein Anas_03209 [Armadillidium nasatum]